MRRSLIGLCFFGIGFWFWFGLGAQLLAHLLANFYSCCCQLIILIIDLVVVLVVVCKFVLAESEAETQHEGPQPAARKQTSLWPVGLKLYLTTIDQATAIASTTLTTITAFTAWSLLKIKNLIICFNGEF